MKAHWKYIAISLFIGWFVGAACILAFSACRFGGHRGKNWGGMRHKLYNELKLSPDQSTKAEAILRGSREKIEGIRKSARDEIRQLLSPEQQARFDTHNAKKDARRRRFKPRE